MRRFLFTLGLLLPLAFLSGCTGSEEPATQYLQANQISIVAPAFSKADGTDLGGDFSLTLSPSRATSIQRPGFNLRAPRGCVAQTLTITGDWCGDDREDPAIGYDYGPEGTEFLIPLQAQFILRSEDLGEADPADLIVVLDHEDGTYEIVPSTVSVVPGDGLENPGTVRIAALLEHFSKYLVAVGPPPDGGHNE
jgi:hypothetical protein